MFKRRSSLFPALLALSVAAMACPSPRSGGGGGGGDDDDAVGDDDDAVGDDDDAASDDDDFTADDDDAVDDDDGAGFDADGISFTFAMNAVEGINGSVTITGSYTIAYWVDIQNGIPQCDQVMEFQAAYHHGFGLLTGCTNCTGYIEFNQAQFQDVSNPNLDPDHCLPADLDAAGANYGVRLTAPADPNAVPPNYGDFGDTLGLIDRDTHDTLGTDWSISSEFDRTAAGSDAQWEQYQLAYTHTGFVNATGQSLSGQAGLDTLSRPENHPDSPASLYLAAWEFFLNPQMNTNDGSNLDGDYGGQASFILTLGQGG